MVQACIIVVYIHVLVITLESTISKPGRFDIRPWYKVFSSIWVLLFTDVTWHRMASSHKCTDPLCTFESTFVHASILLLTCDLWPSVAWIWTRKIIILFLEKSILALFILRWVKPIYIWWQALHRCWIYTLGHSVHVTCFLFYWKWCRKFIIIYRMWILIVFIWF